MIDNRNLIVFDTSTLPEYYNDVHCVLSLPAGHVVTYDYSAGNISGDAETLLLNFKDGTRVRVVLVYIQAEAYEKGNGSASTNVLVEPTIQTLTRLAWIVAVRSVQNGTRHRYYFDLELGGYPNDLKGVIAKDFVAQLRGRNDIPMKTYVAVIDSTEVNALFEQNADEQGFSKVVNALSQQNSQYRRDTFWRFTSIEYRTKSIIPLWLSKKRKLEPRTIVEGNRRVTYVEVVDQSTIYLTIQFQRGAEHGSDYRIRKVVIDGSPKVASDLVRSSFSARSFGQETVAVTIPATSSLAVQEIRIQFTTQLHESDEIKDYSYGPQVAIQVRYRKGVIRSLVAVSCLLISSIIFAWAAFATSFATSAPISGDIVPLKARALAVGLGVLLSLYSYYLWSDDISLDKARRG